MTGFTASAYLFAHDVLDETPEVVLDRLQQAGVQGAVMAAAYHHSRDVFPHNPRRKVAYLEGGTVFFRPRLAEYARLQPRVATISGEQDLLAMLCDAAAIKGMPVSAWVVVLHNSRLGFEAPDCAPLTALGDRLLNCLCPSNPNVRTFARALCADVARYPLESIKLESLSYMPFDHGYHHERSFVPLSPNIRFLLGVCFCEHCLAVAQSRKVDAERVRAWVSDRLLAVFESASNESDESDVEESKLRNACDGEFGRYLDCRMEVVSSLAAEVATAVHAVSPKMHVVFLDLSGATLGYATGRPATDATALSVAWRDGIDVVALGERCDGIGMLGYFADNARFEREVRAYLDALAGRPLEVILRPMAPDSRSSDELAAKLAVVRRLGVREMAFYHYGMMRLESLDWISDALGRL